MIYLRMGDGSTRAYEGVSQEWLSAHLKATGQAYSFITKEQHDTLVEDCNAAVEQKMAAARAAKA